MAHDDNYNLKLLYATAIGLPYNPPSYTSIKEFTNSFPEKETASFVAQPSAAESAWQLDPPYPRIYTKDYRKSILSTLKQTIAKT